MTNIVFFFIASIASISQCASSFTITRSATKRMLTPPLFYTINNDVDTEAMKQEIEEMRLEAMNRIRALSEKVKAVESSGDFLQEKVVATRRPAPPRVSSMTGTTTANPVLEKPRVEEEVKTATSESSSKVETSKPAPAAAVVHKDDLELLDDTHWKIALNIGREPGTWMPKTWGISGDRLLINLELCFSPKQLYDREEFLGGVGGAKICRVIDQQCILGPSQTEGSRVYRVQDGGYRICKGDGPLGTDLLRFYFELEEKVQHTGSDVYCPKGRVYCTCGFFPQNVGAGRGKKYHLRQSLQDLEKSYSDIQYQVENPDNKVGFWKSLELQRKLFQLNLEIQKVQKQLSDTRVTEPDTSLLRFSRKRDVALTKEGGVCCKVIKEGGRREFHILGKFGVGAVEAREGHE